MTLGGTISVGEAAGRAWDAVVVGAGPAGSVAARELARRGRSVLLVDKAAFPRGKVCGCCLNAAAVGTLAAIGLGDVVRRCRAVPLDSVRFAAGGRGVTLPLPGGVAVSREAFDAALIREAVAVGAEFLPGTAAKSSPRAVLPESAASPIAVTLAPGADRPRSERTTFARVVVLAAGLTGGPASAVRPGSRIGAGTVADDASRFYEPGTIHMAVGRGGYAGLVRLEDGRLDVAAAFDPALVRQAGGPGRAAEQVLNQAGLPAVPGLAALPWRGTPALTRKPARVSGPRWFAVGDAAGYVEPLTGEGMAWAVAGAAALAPVAARAAHAADWDSSFAAEWAAAHQKIVGSRQGVCRAVARLARSPRLARLSVAALSLAPALARPVVARLNRPPARPTPEPVP